MLKVGGYKKTIIIATLFLMLFVLLVPAGTRLSAQGVLPASTGAAIASGVHETAVDKLVTERTNALKKQLAALMEAYQNTSDPEQQRQLTARIKTANEQIADQDTLRKQAETDIAEGKQNSKKSTDSGCSLWNFSIGQCILEAINWMFSLISGPISATFLIIGGKILDVSVWASIEKMPSFLEAAGIIYVWTISRDLANMALIFILLYAAFNIVIDRSIGSDPKKLITAVVVVALMVNFSGFFVRAAVDISNVIAYEFYQVISNESSGASGFGIGGQFLKNMDVGKLVNGIVSAYQSGGDLSSYVQATSNLSIATILGNFLLGTVFAIFISFVFVYIAILFFIRTITILAIFMASPLMVLSYAIPGQQKKFTDWVKKLLDQAIFAPAMMFLLFAILKILEKGSPVKPEDFSGFIGGTFGGSLSLAVYYTILLGLTLKSVGLAKDLGAMGSDLAKGWAGKATGALLGGGTAAAAAIGGKMGNLPGTKRVGGIFNRWYGSEKFGAGTARAIGRSAAGQAIGTFARNPISGTMGGVGRLGKSIGGNPIDMGTATKWTNIAEESKKNREKQLEERTFGSGDNKFSDEAVVANFMGLGAADQKFAYSKMSEKQRALLDHTLANPGNKKDIIDNILKAEKLDPASIALITDPARQQQAQTKADLRRKEISKKVDPILDDPTKIASAQSGVVGLKNVLSGKDKTEINKAYRNIEGKAESSAGKNIANGIIDDPARTVDDGSFTEPDPADTTGATRRPIPALDLVKSIRSINSDDIVSMFESDPTKFLAAGNFVKFLTGKQLKSLVNNSTISKAQSADIVNVLNGYQTELNRTGQTDKDLENAIKFIDKNPDLF